jgi:hypothetical protein
MHLPARTNEPRQTKRHVKTKRERKLLDIPSLGANHFFFFNFFSFTVRILISASASERANAIRLSFLTLSMQQGRRGENDGMGWDGMGWDEIGQDRKGVVMMVMGGT